MDVLPVLQRLIRFRKIRVIVYRRLRRDGGRIVALRALKEELASIAWIAKTIGIRDRPMVLSHANISLFLDI